MSIFLTMPLIILLYHTYNSYYDKQTKVLPKDLSNDIINKNYILKHCIIPNKKKFYYDEEKINDLLNKKLAIMYDATHDSYDTSESLN